MSELAQTYQVEQIIFVMKIECFYYYIIFMKGFVILLPFLSSVMQHACVRKPPESVTSGCGLVLRCLITSGSHSPGRCDTSTSELYGGCCVYKPSRVTLSKMAGVKRDIIILCIVGCTGCVPNHCVATFIASIHHQVEPEVTFIVLLSVHSSSSVCVPVKMG